MTLETPKEKQIYGFAMVDCQGAQKLILAPASTPKGKSSTMVIQGSTGRRVGDLYIIKGS